MQPCLKISDNSKITVLTTPKRHVHALRQLKHYFPNCQLQIVDIKENAPVKNDSTSAGPGYKIDFIKN